MPQRMLLSLMKAEHLVIPTKLLAWYLDHGMKVTNLYNILQLSNAMPFEEWVKNLAQKHRDAAEQGSTVHDIMTKLCGNASYGYALFQPERRNNVRYINSEKLKFIQKNGQHKKFKFVGPEENLTFYVEITSKKKRAVYKLPAQFACEVLGLSKLQMLVFSMMS